MFLRTIQIKFNVLQLAEVRNQLLKKKIINRVVSEATRSQVFNVIFTMLIMMMMTMMMMMMMMMMIASIFQRGNFAIIDE